MMYCGAGPSERSPLKIEIVGSNPLAQLTCVVVRTRITPLRRASSFSKARLRSRVVLSAVASSGHMLSLVGAHRFGHGSVLRPSRARRTEGRVRDVDAGDLPTARPEHVRLGWDAGRS